MSFFSKQMLIGVAIGAVLGWLVFGLVLRPAPQVTTFVGAGVPQSKDCAVKKSKSTVQGTSLGNLLKNGAEVKILDNYYACNEAKRNDIVEYNYPGSSVPIAKRIVGVTGDKFALKATAAGYNLLINGDVAKTSEGSPYVLDDHAYRVLSLYVKDYKGVIPPDAYLIMGDLPGGSLDSTQFGLVGKDDFLGKIAR